MLVHRAAAAVVATRRHERNECNERNVHWMGGCGRGFEATLQLMKVRGDDKLFTVWSVEQFQEADSQVMSRRGDKAVDSSNSKRKQRLSTPLCDELDQTSGSTLRAIIANLIKRQSRHGESDSVVANNEGIRHEKSRRLAWKSLMVERSS